MIPGFENCKKIAVMGGTFDPIHFGHLATAEAVCHKLAVDRVVFIPTGHPAHKLDKPVTHPEHRYRMTLLATLGNPKFCVSRMEIDRAGPTYTIDTILELKRQLADSAILYFIMGADGVHEIETWKEWERLLTLCNFVAVTRPGYQKNALAEEIGNIREICQSKIQYMEVPALAISSSDLRMRVQAGIPIRYLVPEDVLLYIEKYGLYQESYESGVSLSMDTETMKEKLQSALSVKRYMHTLAVSKEAERLAGLYGSPEDAERAKIAGLLHDCAKDYPEEHRKRFAKEYHVPLDDVMKKNPELIHPFLGAEVAKREYLVTDPEILDAIRYHTTGRKGMGLVEKAVFVADYIEPGREPFDGLLEARRLAGVDLDLAVRLILEQTIHYVKKKKRVLHPLSVEALQYYTMK